MKKDPIVHRFQCEECTTRWAEEFPYFSIVYMKETFVKIIHPITEKEIKELICPKCLGKIITLVY